MKIKMLTTPNAGKDADKLDHADTAGENVKHAAAWETIWLVLV